MFDVVCGPDVENAPSFQGDLAATTTDVISIEVDVSSDGTQH